MPSAAEYDRRDMTTRALRSPAISVIGPIGMLLLATGLVWVLKRPLG